MQLSSRLSVTHKDWGSLVQLGQGYCRIEQLMCAKQKGPKFNPLLPLAKDSVWKMMWNTENLEIPY